MPDKFRGFPNTPVPEFLKDWEDDSWHMDGAASCKRKVPTKKNPDAQLVAWVFYEESPRFILEWWPTRYVPHLAPPAVLYRGDDIAGLEAETRRFQ